MRRTASRPASPPTGATIIWTGSDRQQNNSRFGTEPTFVNATTQIDFSTSYDITPQLNVYFSALNLNNATYSTHGRFSEQGLDVVDHGRQIYAGFPVSIIETLSSRAMASAVKSRQLVPSLVGIFLRYFHRHTSSARGSPNLSHWPVPS